MFLPFSRAGYRKSVVFLGNVCLPGIRVAGTSVHRLRAVRCDDGGCALAHTHPTSILSSYLCNRLPGGRRRFICRARLQPALYRELVAIALCPRGRCPGASGTLVSSSAHLARHRPIWSPNLRGKPDWNFSVRLPAGGICRFHRAGTPLGNPGFGRDLYQPRSRISRPSRGIRQLLWRALSFRGNLRSFSAGCAWDGTVHRTMEDFTLGRNFRPCGARDDAAKPAGGGGNYRRQAR
jgi:hypothetical protein